MLQYRALQAFFFQTVSLKFLAMEKRLDNLSNGDAKSRIRDFLLNYVKENAEENSVRVAAKNIFFSEGDS